MFDDLALRTAIAMSNSPSVRKRPAQAMGLLDELPAELGVEPVVKRAVRWKVSGGRRRRLCNMNDNCSLLAVRGGKPGLCTGHGGGRRCGTTGCTNSAEGKTEHCKKHGGGRRCLTAGCTESAQGNTEHCIAHGGGRRCSVTGCPTGARGMYCATHGGGLRCKTGAHLGEETPPLAKYKLSAAAGPEFEGVRCCSACLKHMDPTNVAVNVHLRKEFFVVSEIAAELARRGLGELVAKMIHDCPAGSSGRRMDLFFNISKRLILDFENDEDQHRDRDTSCEHAKLMGHLMDHGAAGYSKQESALWEPPHPTDQELDALFETDADTSEMQKLRCARTRATQRVMRDFNAKRRAVRGEGSGESCIAPKLHVIRFNCDKYTNSAGEKVGSLFCSAHLQDEDAPAKLKTTKLFASAIRDLCDRMQGIVQLEKDDAWFGSKKELEVEYVRYDECP